MRKLIIFIENKYDYLFAFLILVLPFSNALPNLLLGVLVLFFSITFKKELFINYHKSPFFILNLLVLYLFFQAIINNTFLQDISFYDKYFYLIIIPILILKVQNVKLLKTSALITINLTVLLSIYTSLKFYYYFKYLPFADSWATNSVLHLERPYAGIFSVICVILSFEQLMTNKKRKYLYIVSLLLSLFFIFFISIRISIITLFILFFLYGIVYLKMNWKKKILFSTGLVLLFALIFLLNKNISKRFFLDDNFKSVVQTTKESEPRVVIWGCVKDLTHQEDFSTFFGTDSYYNIKNSLVRCYSESVEDYSRRNFFVERSFNTHSQFLDLYLIGGVIAILLFILFIVKSLYFNYKNFYTVAIIVSYIMILTIENIFHRQFGCFIFSVFTSLYMNRNQIKSNEQN